MKPQATRRAEPKPTPWYGYVAQWLAAFVVAALIIIPLMAVSS